ncbi:MAG: 50S ribosomal protein L4 [Saprospirales bacterium]|jgi:large subunit ribosomal protein L4|nr:50S ribosomal protein L4 [Saprospirales bacterium]MBK7335307.1 50S ribosomal protein L4 [Saprospirales bacterium]
MKLEVLNIQGEKTGRSVDLPDNIFGIEPNEHAVYLAVKLYLANQRQGTHKAKERSEMSGSTRKLHRQKGTGGSRKGDINNPLYRGGGRVFGPRPRDYGFKLNKKVKHLARQSALSVKATAGQIMVVEDFSFDTPKTKKFLEILQNLHVFGKKTVFVTADYEKEVLLSSRNVPHTQVTRAGDLNTYQVMNSSALVLSESSIGKIVETFA